MRHVILLFDIDGTLLHAHGAGRRALDRAFYELVGQPAVTRAIDLRGMTDPLIVAAGFRAIGAFYTKDQERQLLKRYVELLEVELEGPDSASVLPGVNDLLDWLRLRSARMAIGLGTGNVEAGATAKLKSVGLCHHFGFGGFGSDHQERSEILRVGARRGAAHLGAKLTDCRVIVLGDTLKDVQAALAIGADCIAVGTGGIELPHLLAEGAHLAVPTLEDPAVRHYVEQAT